MSEDREQRPPLSPEERAEQVRQARERAAAARAARETGGAAPAPASEPAAQAEPAAAAEAPTTAERAAPLSAEERAAAVEAARARAAAARAAREGGAAPVPAQPAASAPSTEGAEAAAPARAERAAPLSPEERAAAVEAARARAAAARASREGGAAPAPAQPRAPQPAGPAPSPEERAAAVATAQERAAAVRAQRAASVAQGGRAATATVEAPAWRVGPGGVTAPVSAARPEPRTMEQATASPLQRMVRRRRDLLRGGFWAGVAMLAVGGLASTLNMLNPRDITGFGGVITVPGSLVPKPGDDPLHYLEGKLYLVNLKPGEGVPDPFLSIGAPSKDGGLLALYQKCVHLGCTVPWRPDFQFGGVNGWFRCPCHGSTYTKGGVRVFGPAPRSLDTFKIVKVDANGVAVDTGKITLGNTTDPQRTVPPGPFT